MSVTMLNRAGILAFAVLLTSCSSPTDKARAKYKFLKDHGGTLGEVCDAGRDMLRVQADAQDSGYKEDRVIVDVDCMSADLRGRDMPANQEDAIYTMEPDNMDAALDTPEDILRAPSSYTSPRQPAAEVEPQVDENGEIGRNEFQGE